LGLIGDMMQRIYGDGKSDLGKNLPDRWVKPIKLLNRRCPKRIIGLANDIRSDGDQQVQIALEGQAEGFVRLFVRQSDIGDKAGQEANIRQKMAEITGDEHWIAPRSVKTLALEHRMSAIRMGFADMLTPLLASRRLATGALDGSLNAITLFSESVWPLFQHVTAGESYEVMTLLREKRSPLLSEECLRAASKATPLSAVRHAVESTVSLIGNSPEASFLEVLRHVASRELFRIPRSLAGFLPDLEGVLDEDVEQNEDESDSDSQTKMLESIRAFLNSQFRQIDAYKEYISDRGEFATHQGVKGLQFERVMVVMDDAEARGFLFSYEKLFGVKAKSTTDLKNIADGKETSDDRTRRLFYVTCTRAQKSLALVAYTANPAELAKSVIAKRWFREEEIVVPRQRP